MPHPTESLLHEVLDREETPIAGCIWAAKESAIKSVGNALPDRQVYFSNLALTKFLPMADRSAFQFHAALLEDAFPESFSEAESDLRETRIEARGIVRKTEQWIIALAISYSVPKKLEQ